MTLKNTFTDTDGSVWNFDYEDSDDFSTLEKDKCSQCYAVCFVDGKVVIVHNGKKDTWGLIGGTIENGESSEDALKREVLEEGNIEIIEFKPIGYQKAYGDDPNEFSYQLRYVAIGRKVGEFEKDLGGGSVDKIDFVDIDQLPNYFDWGEVGKRIIERAKELHLSLKSENREPDKNTLFEGKINK